MEILKEGIVVFRDYFLRNEEVIHMAENSPNWRPGTAGGKVDAMVRITDIHDLDNTTELHRELLDTFTDGINEYISTYKHLKITAGEHLRVGRYGKGGHYKVHTDAGSNNRVLSAILYLNGDYEGGQLEFPNHDIEVKPEAGMLVLFPSNFLFAHGAKPVTEGRKFIALGWFS